MAINKIHNAMSNYAIALMDAGAMICDLPQVSGQETAFPLITKQAYIHKDTFVTVFNVFVRYGCLAGVNYLLGLGYEPDMITKLQSYQVIKNASGSFPVYIYTNYTEETPLMTSIEYNQSIITDLLISSGANVNVTNNKTGANALIYAAYNNNANITNSTLYAGINYNITDNTGRTAFEIATDLNYTDVATIIAAYITLFG